MNDAQPPFLNYKVKATFSFCEAYQPGISSYTLSILCGQGKCYACPDRRNIVSSRFSQKKVLHTLVLFYLREAVVHKDDVGLSQAVIVELLSCQERKTIKDWEDNLG